jgi:hypothetical protein
MGRCQQNYSKVLLHYVHIVQQYVTYHILRLLRTLLHDVLVRDYIHVVDLADGNVFALRKLFESSSNIGLHRILPSCILNQKCLLTLCSCTLNM